jgi:iron complex outermembrane receptor protein
MLDYDFATNYDDAGRRQDEFGNHFDFALPQDGATRTVLGLYVEDLFAARPGLNLVAGGRVDLYSDFGTAVSPRAGAVWRRGDLIAKLFYGWAFRAPTFQELYDQTGRIDLGQFVGNPDLKASRIRTLEGSVAYTRPLDAVLLEVTVTGAYSQIRDSIDRAALSGLDNTFLNTSDIDAGAASAELRLDWSGRLAAFANGSWQIASDDYEYVDPDAGLNIRTDTRLVNVPPYRFNAGLHGRLTARLSAGVRAEIGGRRQNNERTPLEAQHFFDYPPYAILSAHARFDDMWEGLYLAIDAVNLTDAAVADEPFRANRMPLGIPRDRLQLGVTLGMDF